MRRLIIMLGLLGALILSSQAYAALSGTIPSSVVSGCTINSVSLSGTTFTGGSTSGTVVGTMSANTTGSCAAATWSITSTGSDHSSTTCNTSSGTDFQASGSSLELNTTLAAGTYSNICYTATIAGATGSPFTQAVTITGTSGDFTFTALHVYYISPASGNTSGWGNGSDSNNGTSTATPWLTPNHSGIVCGDIVLLAQATTYANGSFNDTFTQPSNCPSTSGGIDGTGGVYAAVLLCSGLLESCKETGTSTIGMSWTVNNWSVQGVKIDTASNQRAFEVRTCSAGAGVTLHDHFIINDISTNNLQAFDVNDCGSATANAGGDYEFVIGLIAEHSASDPICLAAIDFVGIGQFDANAGTHDYAYTDYAWNNLSPSCIGTSDGEDYMDDTQDFHNSNSQVVFANDIGYTAERFCLQIFHQNNHNNTPTIKVYNLTCYADLVDVGSDSADGELNFNSTTSTNSYTVVAQNNIARTNAATSNGHPIYAMSIGGAAWSGMTNGGSGNQNILFGSATTCANGGTCNSGPPYMIDATNGSSIGTNTYSDPAFTNPTDLTTNQNGTPNCSAFINTTQCMGYDAITSTLTTPSIISDLVPTLSGSSTKGFQLPSTTCTANADYSSHLKGIVYLQWNGGTSFTEKAGLVTKPCNL
jgi:hypothetical protein